MFGKCLPKSYEVRISLNKYNYNKYLQNYLHKADLLTICGTVRGSEMGFNVNIRQLRRTKSAAMPFMMKCAEEFYGFLSFDRLK